MSKLLTITEAAILTGYTDSYLRRLLRRGDLVGQRYGQRLWLVDAKSAKKLASKPYSGGRPKTGITR